jgi:branched-chain amino acid transport system ATP-binding protein
VRHLDAYYGESHVLQGIDLAVPAGGRVAVLGRNGAGKSTLLKSIMNAGPTMRGEVLWMGEDLRDLPSYKRVKRGLALVPEDRRILTHISVRENIAFAVRYGSSADRPGLDVDGVLARFPMLAPLADRMGGELSGGQQQMLAVARAIAAHPRMILLDEPTEGLAPVIVQQLASDVIASCSEAHASLLLCEQNIWFARQCTDFLYIIDSGRIVFQDDWAAFDRDESVKLRYLAV